MPDDLKARVKSMALEVGFDEVRVTTTRSIPHAGERLMHFLGEGRHGDMEWMESTAARRASPHLLWPEAKSIIVLGMNYGPDKDPLDILKDKQAGAVSVYAQGKDYHDIIKKKLKRVAGWLHRSSGMAVKVFVDTAPLMEKPLGEAAGLGWQGKHTNLVSRKFGSWLFLGSIMTTAELQPDQPEKDHCGSCRLCLDICPTDAFPAPYELDARRCISYLTIEHKGHIPEALRAPMGNRIFGCDDCLAVCPWNKYAQTAREVRLKAREGAGDISLAALLKLDDTNFRARFAGSPVKRTGRDRFIRNTLIAAGNSGDASLLPDIERLLNDASPLVRAMAVWALKQLTSADEFSALSSRFAGDESDTDVRAEWTRAARL
ncbi:epoxyqueuosine reductase [bacterium MnTg02]|nr:epoxyqueuosine reductase [bacterium MnTg02]